MSEEAIFTLFYIIISACLVYPPVEFHSAGFTIPFIFRKVLGREEENFIVYHMRKSIVNTLCYSALPLIYFFLLYLNESINETNHWIANAPTFWTIFFASSTILFTSAVLKVKQWMADDFQRHPTAINLSKFCNNNANWKGVASDINNEFRRIGKICIETNPLIKVVATENWILKVGTTTVNAAHQSDANLVVKEADVHQISYQMNQQTQYLNIEVKSDRQNVETFVIRINAKDFKDLQDRITRTIAVLPEVTFHKTVLEQFVDVFKETIKQNVRYETQQELEQCIACLQARPNVKLQKLCIDEGNQSNNCTTCYCRPMWCADCMAKWFASRQESDQQSTWLSSKCTCPMCRSKFCILDVCLIDHENL